MGHEEAHVAKNVHGSYDSNNPLMASTFSYSIRKWIHDSGCSYYIFLTRELLFDFKELDGSSVRLGKGYPCRIREEVKIKLKQIYGKVRVLKNVWYSKFYVESQCFGCFESSSLKLCYGDGDSENLLWWTCVNGRYKVK